MELEGPPMLSNDTGSSDLYDARDRAITLELTNRFAVVKGESPLFHDHESC